MPIYKRYAPPLPKSKLRISGNPKEWEKRYGRKRKNRGQKSSICTCEELQLAASGRHDHAACGYMFAVKTSWPLRMGFVNGGCR